MVEGNNRVGNYFEHIGVLGLLDSAKAVSTLESLSDFVLKQGKRLYFDERTGKALGNFNGKADILDIDSLCATVNLLIVVGGDGTLLSSARAAARHGIPVLGVNRGSLGFLTDINPAELESSLLGIFAGEFLLEERFLIQAKIDGKFIGTALNDIVLNSGTAVSMVEYELYVDEHFVYSQSADGLIISTPTGSTAYALSGGGPIMHPSLNALVLVPICPHTLSSRPMVIDGNSKVYIVPGSDSHNRAQIACDGQQTHKLSRGQSIEVEKYEKPLLLMHPKSHEFYEACRSKLGWGTKLS